MPSVYAVLPWIDSAASILDLAKSGNSLAHFFWRHHQSTHQVQPDPHKGLDDLEKLLNQCESFLQDVKHGDPLMGEVVEHNDPGWIDRFRGRELSGDQLTTSAAAYESPVYLSLKDEYIQDADKLDPGMVALDVEAEARVQTYHRSLAQSVAPSSIEEPPASMLRKRRTVPSSSTAAHDLEITNYPIQLTELRHSESDRPYDYLTS
ncbi:hypothetical protein OBBRIDRAFT_803832 [Obba rivulosa]|uniref:Uncharacterized protein n=1 Tax=Obba rivulosa TaxID=1052685 RepID=A0A8E2AWV0_9APHY|nr:hypothetical protein OBBRIDRAFT_803832 [Obba rivulosa]